MDTLNLLAYTILQHRYNQSFRRKYQITVNQFYILSNVYYYDQAPPPGRVRQAILLLNKLYKSNIVHEWLLLLRSKGMIQYDKEANGYYIVHLLPHVRRDLEALYDLEAIEAYIEETIKKR